MGKRLNRHFTKLCEWPIANYDISTKFLYKETKSLPHITHTVKMAHSPKCKS